MSAADLTGLLWFSSHPIPPYPGEPRSRDRDEELLIQFLDAQLDAAYFLKPFSSIVAGKSQDFTIQYANQRAVDLSGMALPELLGQRITALPQSPEDTRSFLNACRAVFESHQPFEDEFLIQGNSHRSHWFRYRISFLMGGLYVTVRDVTADKDLHLSLLDLSLQHEQMLEGILDGFLVLDRNLRVLYANMMGEVVLQCRRQDALGNPVAHLLPEPLATRFSQVAERVLHTEVQMDFDAPHGPLNLEFLVTIRCTFNGICAVFKDITQLRQHERTLEEMLRRHESLTQNIPGAIYQFALTPDNAMSFLSCSSGIKHLIGLEPHEFCEKFKELLLDLPLSEQQHFEQSVIESARALSIWCWEGEVKVHGSGHTRWLRATSRPSLRADGTVVWDGVMIDLTEQHRAVEMLAKQSSGVLR